MVAANNRTRRMSVLLVDDDREFADALTPLLAQRLNLRTVSDGETALAAHGGYDAVIIAVELAGQPDGLELLRRIRSADGRTPIYMLARTQRPEIVLQAGRLSATDYFLKRSDAHDQLAQRILDALEQHASTTSSRSTESAPGGEAEPEWEFVGESDEIRRLLAESEMVAQVDSPILITGEHGTGKEVLARYIHRRSARAQKPFVAVNCAAMPEGLAESELFGHEKGAFTGAVGRRRGKFELADEGTLLLDEITEMPQALQPKLLRALQSGEFVRVGSEQTQRSDARVICSTNRDPNRAVAEGLLRHDLYYRINVVTLHIPPLREHRDDVQTLTQHFLHRKCRELGKHVERISPAAESLLLGHDWPGNVRELENLIERAVVFCRSNEIGPELLGPICEGAAYLALPWEEARNLATRRFERSYLSALLRVYRGSVSKCAQDMRISRQALYKILDHAELDPAAFRGRRRRR
jgi:DNA-binding NtrC family response regulator